MCQKLGNIVGVKKTEAEERGVMCVWVGRWVCASCASGGCEPELSIAVHLVLCSAYLLLLMGVPMVA